MTSIVRTGPTAIVIGLATTPLATSSTFIAGRESNEINSGTDIDAWVDGKFTVGTTPTLPCQLNLYVWGANQSLATLTYDQANAAGFDTLTGADGDRTLTNTGVLTNALKLADAFPILVNTTGVTYPIKPFSVAALFGWVMPAFWGLFIAHNMTAALSSTANLHAFNYTGIKFA